MASKVWTAAEFEQMTPAECRAIFDGSIVTDLDQVPPEFLARFRARVEKTIAAPESTGPGPWRVPSWAAPRLRRPRTSEPRSTVAAAGLRQVTDEPLVHYSPGVSVRCGWPGWG